MSAPPAGGPHHLLHLLGDGGGDGGVADVGVDLDQEVLADDHRLGLGVAPVGGDDRPADGHLPADELGVHALAGGREAHLRGDGPGLGVGQLGGRAAGRDALGGPLPPGRGKAPVDVDVRGGVGVRAGGVVQVEVAAVAEFHPALRDAERVSLGGVDLPVDLGRSRDGTGGHPVLLGGTGVAAVESRHGMPPYVGITRTGSAVGDTVESPSQPAMARAPALRMKMCGHVERAAGPGAGPPAPVASDTISVPTPDLSTVPGVRKVSPVRHPRSRRRVRAGRGGCS